MSEQKKNGVVHQIGNPISGWLCAQSAILMGGHPYMAEEKADIKMIPIPDALVLNLGMLTANREKAMKQAVQRERVSTVMDAVGVHLSRYRRNFARKMLKKRSMIIKGNAAEIAALLSLPSLSKGLEAKQEITPYLEEIKKYAQKTGHGILITGKFNYCIIEEKIFCMEGKRQVLKDICGTGCALGTGIGVYLALGYSRKQSILYALSHMHLAAEKVQKEKPMEFLTKWLDQLYSAPKEEIMSYSERFWRVKS